MILLPVARALAREIGAPLAAGQIANQAIPKHIADLVFSGKVHPEQRERFAVKVTQELIALLRRGRIV